MNDIQIFKNRSDSTPSVKTLSTTGVQAYSSDDTDDMNILRINDTQFFIAYRDNPASNEGKSIIGTIDASDNITYGSVTDFNTGTQNYYQSTLLTPTSALVLHGDRGRLVEMTISGASLTKNNVVVDADVNPSRKDIIRLSDNRALMLYADDSYNLSARVCNVSTPNITFGSKYVLYSSDLAYGVIGKAINDDQVFCLVYFQGMSKTRAYIITTSGNVVTRGSFYDFVSGDDIIGTLPTFKCGIEKINDNQMIIAYETGDYINIRVANIDTTTKTISLGTLYTTSYGAAAGPAVNIHKIEDNHFICTYNGSGTYSGQIAFSIYCDGNTIVVSENLLSLASGNVVIQDSCVLNPTKALAITESPNWPDNGIIYPITIS